MQRLKDTLTCMGSGCVRVLASQICACVCLVSGCSWGQFKAEEVYPEEASGQPFPINKHGESQLRTASCHYPVAFCPSLVSCFQGLSTVSSTNPDEMDTQIVPGPACKLPDRPPPVYLAGMMANIHSHPPSVNPQLQLKPSLKAMLEASNKKTQKGNAGGNQQCL